MADERELPRLGPLQVLLLVAAVLASRVLVLSAVPIYDDAFITYRYAENLAAGLGLVFNPGAAWEPILGTTAPGYALGLAGLVALGADVIRASLATNFACDALSAFLLLRLLRFAPLSGTLTALLFAGLPQLARISAGGMEAPVLLAVLLSAVSLLRAERPAAWAAGGLLSAIACTLRPECVLLVGLFAVDSLWRSKRRLIFFLVPVLAFGLVYVAWVSQVYGTPIPQSVTAKSGFVKPPWTVSFASILREAYYPLWPMVVALPVVAWGAVRGLRSPLRVFCAFALLVVAAYLAARPKTWGWYYYLPLTAWGLWAGLGVEGLLARRARSKLERFLAGRGAYLVAPVLVAGIAWTTSRLPDEVTAPIYGGIEAWADEARIAERDDRILASDIGAVAFYTGARVLDTEGLVWPAALEYDDKLGAIREHRPEYVFLVANHDRLVPFRSDPELAAAYRPIRRFSASPGDTDLEPALDELPQRWVQDYILYERVDR